MSCNPTKDKLDKIFLPVIQSIAMDCAGSINEIRCPPEFIAEMVRDIADVFETPLPEGEIHCSCC